MRHKNSTLVLSNRFLVTILTVFLCLNLGMVGWGLWRNSHSNHLLRVTFLDVGQGDSAVIETPSGKTLVIDAGGVTQNDDEGRRTVAPYLRFRGIRQIDGLLLTHPDADHIGGAATLLERFPVALLLENGQLDRDGTPVVHNLLATAKNRAVTRKGVGVGQKLDFGDGVTAQVLSPTSSEVAGDKTNEASIVLRLAYGKTSFLFTGDADFNAEAEMLRSGQPLASDVLKVGHHGSRSSSSPAFLSAVHPHYAVLSVGRRNLYGHPTPETMQRLQAVHAMSFRTDKQGAITFTSDGTHLTVETMH